MIVKSIYKMNNFERDGIDLPKGLHFYRKKTFFLTPMLETRH